MFFFYLVGGRIVDDDGWNAANDSSRQRKQAHVVSLSHKGMTKKGTQYIHTSLLLFLI